MAKQRQIAYVLVDTKWWTKDAARLLSPGSVRGIGDVQKIRGPLVAMDFQGVWIGEAPSRLLDKRDKSKTPLPMQILIPWSKVIAIGVVDDPGRAKTGFSVVPVNDVEAEAETV